jgi:hypothetical protein
MITYCSGCGVEISSGTYCSGCDPENGSSTVSLTLIWCTECGCYVESGHSHEKKAS